MPEKCPLCKQSLPTGVLLKTLSKRQEKLVADAVKQEQQRLKRALRAELKTEFERKSAEIERKAVREAEREFKQDLQIERKAMREAERDFKQKLKQAEGKANRKAESQHRKELQAIDSKRAKENARHERDNFRFQQQIESLSRKLDKQASEDRGDEAEVDLYASLSAEFRRDELERIGKGVRGADILQHVMSGGTEVGCIVYESKNVSKWQNAFITKAKGYRTKYKTPYIIVVTTAFPRNNKTLCIVKGVPVVAPHLAPVLARLIRESIVEISGLKSTRDIRPQKARELWEYILSDEFHTRFRDVAESVEQLQELHKKELAWHENHWTKQGKLYDQIHTRRRQIDTRVRNITRRKLRMAT